MLKRYVAGALWAFMIFSGWQLATGLLGMSTLGLVGLILGVLAGAAIALDPGGLIWQPSPTRRVVRIADYDQAEGKRATKPQA